MKKTMWILLDNRAGSVSQARGIELAVGQRLDLTEKQLVYTRAAVLPNWIRGRSLLGVNKSRSSSLSAPWPQLVLSSSRRTLPVARYIRKMSGGQTQIVQLMHPGRSGLKEVSLVVVPEHDAAKCKKGNFFFITGCPHRVTAEATAEAQARWTPIFETLPRPWVSVLVGGAINGRPFSLDNARALGQAVKDVNRKLGGSILITTSRRTGAEAENLIMSEIAGIPAYTYLWGEKKENPIMGFMACADKIIATGDSVSMVSEACGTGRPVLVFSGHNWLTPKHRRFVESLFQNGYAVSADAPDALEFMPVRRLNSSEAVAEKILALA